MDARGVVVLVLLTLASLLRLSTGQLCDSINSCQADCGIDIRNISIQYPFPMTPDGQSYTFTFSPCAGAVCDEVSPSNDNAMCQTSTDFKYSIGKTGSVTWFINQTSPLIFTVTYDGGDEGRKTHVTFYYEDKAMEMKYKDESPQLNYNFEVRGREVALQSESIAGPVGIVLIFLAIGAFITYFIVGGVFMYYKREARGKNVIPNVEFWMGFPLLIKDGICLTISPCYKRGYESVKS